MARCSRSARRSTRAPRKGSTGTVTILPRRRAVRSGCTERALRSATARQIVSLFLAPGLELAAAAGAREAADLARRVALEGDPDAEPLQEEIVGRLGQHLARIVARLRDQLRALTADLDDGPTRYEVLADVAIERVGRRNVRRARPMKLVGAGARGGVTRHDERR